MYIEYYNQNFSRHNDNKIPSGLYNAGYWVRLVTHIRVKTSADKNSHTISLAVLHNLHCFYAPSAVFVQTLVQQLGESWISLSAGQKYLRRHMHFDCLH